MKIEKIYLGSWFPKTGIHLDEFIDFLSRQKVIELLNENEAKKLHAKLKPYGIIEKTRDDTRYVQAQSGIYSFKYFDEGLLMVEAETAGSSKEFDKMLDFYQHKLSPCLAYLFSVGAKGLEIVREPGLKKNFYLCADRATPKDMDKLFKKLNYQVDSVETNEDFLIYRADGFTAIGFYAKINHKQLELLMEYLIVLDEVKRHLAKILQAHRHIWEAAEKIWRSNRIRVKELPENTSLLTDYLTQVSNIEVRLQQMQINIDYRETKAKDYPELYENLRVDFINVKQNLDYIKNLFVMSHRQLDNASRHLSSIYKQNQQSSLYRLQILFLTSVVASLLMLGSLTGASIVFFDQNNNLIASADLISFDKWVLFKFGLDCRCRGGVDILFVEFNL